MKTALKIFSFIVLLSFFSENAFGQAKYTFQLDLTSQMEDSVFVPGKHSAVITGNQLPFTSINSFTLTDGSPADSIYSVEIRFPRTVTGNNLQYQYILKRPKEGDKRESQKRSLRIQNGIDQTLPATRFNAFVY